MPANLFLGFPRGLALLQLRQRSLQLLELLLLVR